MVLVRCLSPNAATITHLTAGQYIGTGGKRERVNVVEGPEATQAAFVALFKPPEKPQRRSPES